MNNKIKIVLVLFFGLVLSCAKNPFTGERTMAFVPNSQIFPSAFQQYGQFLSENKVVKGTTDAKRIENIGMKIKTAAERWLNANGKSDYLEGYAWEYNLVESKELNAWCMPGGKIVFYTGILPVCKDDAGIASVMGHEVAHALANHGQQRMSAGLLQQLGAAGAQVAVGNKDPQTQALVMQAYGVGSQVGGMLPFSRKHESEADMIGLTLMAIAGYDPVNAVKVWERMSALSSGSAPPEILSTHPSNETRIREITSLIPQAKAEAAKFGVTFK
ncbi:peptidase M48 [Flavobacterium sp. 316]|uniref:M48 family metallopeptidase n=1 Tax=Flavobacterium sediminilitoris TaxID=2024526 RepID=A0ABY4HMV7_9FLAO|nr:MULTISPECIES: M48 family metallopeptidase [Flavobacterium]KIX21436.1 peptidase M48 [Flavobacterium sp. 316]UOX34182.1 M48 family metallopeptidase [Flavobacterium sediminilitoris]